MMVEKGSSSVPGVHDSNSKGPPGPHLQSFQSAIKPVPATTCAGNNTENNDSTTNDGRLNTNRNDFSPTTTEPGAISSYPDRSTPSTTGSITTSTDSVPSAFTTNPPFPTDGNSTTTSGTNSNENPSTSA